MNNYDVIVVGAGIAGLSASLQLSKAEFNVCVLDANSSIGGRVNSKLDKNTDDWLDNGQHVMMGVYFNFLSFLKEIGTYDKLHIDKGFKFDIYDKEKKYTFDTTKIFGDLGLLWGLYQSNIYSVKEILRIISFLMEIKNGNLDAIDMTCKELLFTYKQDGRISKYLWSPFIESTLNTKTEIASAKIFINIIKQIFFGKKDAKSFIIPKVPLAELIEPSVELIKSKGGQFKFNSTVKEIIFDENDIALGVRTVKGEEIFAKYIVLTLPPRKLAKFNLPDYYTQLFSEIEYSPIISIYAWLDKNIEQKIIQAIDHNIHWIFNKNYFSTDDNNSNKQVKNQMLSMTISASDELINTPNSELKKLFKNEICSIFKDVSQNNILDMKIIKEKRATFVCSDKTEEIRKKLGKQYNNIIFSGDWVYNNLPPTIEGACLNGINASEIIIRNEV